MYHLLLKIFLCILLLPLASLTQAETRVIWEVVPDTFQLQKHYDHPNVQKQIKTFTARPLNLRDIAIRSEPYVFYIYLQVKERGMPGELILLPKIESAFDPFALSHVGAAGLWQIMPRTGNSLGLVLDWWYDGRRDVTQSTQAALDYFAYLNDQFNDDWLLAIAAYQAGEGTVRKAIRRNRNAGKPTDFWSLSSLPRSTRVYVPNLLAIAAIISDPKKYRAELPSIPYQPYFEEVPIACQLELSLVAELADIPMNELLKLNPGYREGTTAPCGPDVLILPVAQAETFENNLAQLPEDQRIRSQQYVVRSGDTLSGISKRFNVSVKALKQNNNLRSDRIIIGQKLLIPGRTSQE